MSRKFDDYFFSSGQYLLDTAEWVPIPDYPGYYICREGYVFDGKRILKPHRGDLAGHLNVRLRKDGKVHEEYIHRLVAIAFIRNPEGHPIVRHLDDDRENNNADNLAWGTQKDNHEDAVRNGTYRPFTDEARKKSNEKCRRPVIATHLESGEVYEFRSINDAVRALKVQQANVCKVLAGSRPHTRGFYFEYVKKEGEIYD